MKLFVYKKKRVHIKLQHFLFKFRDDQFRSDCFFDMDFRHLLESLFKALCTVYTYIILVISANVAFFFFLKVQFNLYVFKKNEYVRFASFYKNYVEYAANECSFYSPNKILKEKHFLNSVIHFKIELHSIGLSFHISTEYSTKGSAKFFREDD